MALHSTGGSDSEGELRSSPTRPKKEGDTVMHPSAGRQPTVIHRDARVKSSEGLLNQFRDSKPEDDYPTPQGSPTKDKFDDGDETPTNNSTPTEETVPVQRATSVNLGKSHVRNLSAGSARLLDIPKRSGSQTSTPQTGTPKIA